MVKKKESVVVETAKELLKKKNVNFAKWRKEQISKEKLKIIEGNDPKWEAEVIENAALGLVLESLKETASDKCSDELENQENLGNNDNFSSDLNEEEENV